MQRIEIDGVPVFTAPGPDRITAVLTFGVGLRDETFATVEVTHLVEHLVMGTLPKSHLQCNALVDTDLTAFYATGRPDAVRAFLESVCRAISDLPTDRMALEVGVLQAENCPGSHPTVAALLGARYGLRGPGLTVAPGPGPDFLTEATVRAHARRWFVRENATLWCHGDLPAGLSLTLPPGPRPQRPVPEPRRQAGPVWSPAPMGEGAGLLLAGAPRDHALNVGLHVLSGRLTDVARTERGLSYSTGTEVLDVTADRRESALYVDAREGRAAEVGRILWEQFDSLCRTGPTAEELAHVVTGLAEEFDADEDAFVCGELGGAALGELGPVPFLPAEQALAAWRAVTPAQVAAALSAAAATALLVVPQGTVLRTAVGGIEQRPFCGVVPVAPKGRQFRPSAFRRVRDRAARVRLVVSDAGLADVDADGDVHFTPWDGIEAVVPADRGEGFSVITREMCVIPVDPAVQGRGAVTAVRERLPEHLWVRPVAAADVARTAEPVR
ncbi:insulinase family protein [Geodermatophilus sp. SYSU D00815]